MATNEQQGERWSGMGTGWSITSTMIGGIATLGALGYLIDRLFGHRARVPADRVHPRRRVSASYIIWLRYGRGEGDGT